MLRSPIEDVLEKVITVKSLVARILTPRRQSKPDCPSP